MWRRQKTPGAAASEIFGPRPPDPDIDRLEQNLKSRLRALVAHFGSETEARRALLDLTANPRDRAVYKVLLKKNGRGRRRDVSTKIADTRLLSIFQIWQLRRTKPGSDLAFARFYHTWDTQKKVATDNDLRAIARQLQRARKRAGQQ
jgi:hypothetical protein